jgi:hypothetical protein
MAALEHGRCQEGTLALPAAQRSWRRWQQRSQHRAAELSLAQAASYASCGAAVSAAPAPHWRSVRTSAKASALVQRLRCNSLMILGEIGPDGR